MRTFGMWCIIVAISAAAIGCIVMIGNFPPEPGPMLAMLGIPIVVAMLGVAGMELGYAAFSIDDLRERLRNQINTTIEAKRIATHWEGQANDQYARGTENRDRVTELEDSIHEMYSELFPDDEDEDDES